MPFSIVAVLILVSSIVTGAYIQAVSNDSSTAEIKGTPPQDWESVMPGLKASFVRIAESCIDRAVEAQTEKSVKDGYNALWRVNENFRAAFESEVRGSRAPDMTRYGMTVAIGAVNSSLSTLPMKFRTMNRLGMIVDMSGPAAFRALGAVELAFTSRDGRVLNRSIDIDVQRASWYPFALYQMNRMRRDFVNDGLQELLIKEMLNSYFRKLVTDLDRRADLENAGLLVPMHVVSEYIHKNDMTAVILNAIEYAFMIEDQVMFGKCRAVADWYYPKAGQHRILNVPNILEYPSKSYWGYSEAFSDGAFSDSIAFENAIYLDLDDFSKGIGVFPTPGMRIAPTTLLLCVSSASPLIDYPTVDMHTFAGEETGTDVYWIEVGVRGSYMVNVGPDSAHLAKMEIPIHLEFHLDFRNADPSYPENGRAHCQIENLKLFDSEFAGLYCTPGTLAVGVTNSSGIRFQDLPADSSAEIYLDGDNLGEFDRGDFGPGGLVLPRVLSGPHEVGVLLKRGHSVVEQGSGEVRGAARNIDIMTSGGTGNVQFWTLALEYLRNVPAPSRLVKLLELASMMTGYPFPDWLRQVSDNSPESVQGMMRWCAGFDGYLSRLLAASTVRDTLQASFISSLQRGMDLILDLLGNIEAMLENARLSAERLSAIGRLTGSITYSYEGGVQTYTVTLRLDERVYSQKFSKADDESGWYSSGEWEEKALRTPGKFETAMDFLMITNILLSIYMKTVKYTDSRGQVPVSGELDITIDIIKLAAKTCELATKYATVYLAKKLGTSAAKIAAMAEVAGIVVAVMTVIQCIHDEAEKFRGDPAAWGALFTGFDEDTVMFYISVAWVVVLTLQLLAGLGAITAVAPYLAPITAILAIVTVIALMIFNWNAFFTLVSDVLSSGDKDDMISGIQDTLRDTATTVASLNEFPSEELELAARQARGSASLLDCTALMVPGSGLSFELHNLSMFEYDAAWAREHQAKAPRCLRYFIIVLWKQVDDFLDDDRKSEEKYTEESDLHTFTDKDSSLMGGRDQNWDGDISIDGDGIPQNSIEDNLLNFKSGTVAKKKISFTVDGNVVATGMKQWMETLARIGDQMTDWQKRLSRSQAMASYVYGQSGIDYHNDWGFIQVYMAPTYSSCRLKITGSTFRYMVDGEEGNDYQLQLSITNSNGPTNIYLEPNKDFRYRIELSGPQPPLTLKKTLFKSIDVYDLYSSKFCTNAIYIAPKAASIFFTIVDEYNGTAKATLEVLDQMDKVVSTLFTDRKFTCATSPSERIFLTDDWIPGFDFDNSLWGLSDEQKNSLSLRLRFTVGLDRKSDGTYEESDTRYVYLNDIRKAHEQVMRDSSGKFDNQLEYRLTVCNEKKKVETAFKPDGTPVDIYSYILWGRP